MLFKISSKLPFDKDQRGAMRLVPLAVLIAIALGAVWSLTYLRQQQTNSIISGQKVRTVKTAHKNIAYDWNSISYYAAVAAGYEVGWNGGSFSDLEPRVESKLQKRTFLGWKIPSIKTKNLELTSVELALHSSTGTYHVDSILSGNIEHIVGDVRHSGKISADVQIKARWGLLNSFVHREHPTNQFIAKSSYESGGDQGAERALAEREEDLNDQYDDLDFQWELSWMGSGTGVETIARDVRTRKIVPVDGHLEYMLYRLVGGQENGAQERGDQESKTDWTLPSKSVWQTSLTAVVIDDYTGARIRGATVSFNPTGTTDSAGIVEFDLGMWSSGESHQYMVTASKLGYRSASRQVTLSAGESKRVILKLKPKTQRKFFQPIEEGTPAPAPTPKPSEPTQEPDFEFTFTQTKIIPHDAWTLEGVYVGGVTETITVTPGGAEIVQTDSWYAGAEFWEEGGEYPTPSSTIPLDIHKSSRKSSTESNFIQSAPGSPLSVPDEDTFLQTKPISSSSLTESVASAVSGAINAVAGFIGGLF